MPTLTVRLFGGLGLERAGQPLPLPTPHKAALVLAYLLTAHDRSHPRSLLAGLGWGDQPERRARRNLSDALWRIRTLLEPRPLDGGPTAAPVLLFEGDSVRLNPAADLDHDVRRFEAALRDPSDLAAQQSAVDLYRGDLLIGYYDDWVLLERERLRQAYLAGLGRVIAGAAATAAWDEAATAAARLLGADPYREDVTRQLMRFYYRLGRRDRALQQFQTLRAVLTADLGLEPEAETSDLYGLMNAGTPLDPSAEQSAIRNPQSAIEKRGFVPQVSPLVAAPLPGEGAAALHALGSNLRHLPLVGRAAQQTVLADWLAAPRPHPPMLLLQGEAGVGKTRLAFDTAEAAYGHRMFVLWGHYQPLTAPLPYAGLVDALRVGLQLGGPPRLEPIWLSEVSRLMPELGALFPGLPPPISLPPDQERIRLWEALTRYLLALAAIGPHLFVLEDVQWVDPATLDLLQYALPRLRSSGVGLRMLVTARSEDVAAAPALAATLRNLEVQGMLGYLPLERLSQAAVGHLVQAALGLPTPAPGFSAHLWSETEGNPFFALETLRFWAERNRLTRAADGTWLLPAGDYTALPTPVGVRRVLEQRLARLTPAARAVIEIGAVLGRQVPERLLWRASGSTPAAVIGPADELLRGQLWQEAADGYTFARRKVLEVAYSGISGPRRRHLHRLAAQALEAEGAAPVEQLAHHWVAAGDLAQALPHLQEAAERAVAAFAHREALAFYDQALGGVQADPGLLPPEAGERLYALIAGRAAVNARLEQVAAATADLDWLVESARDGGQPGRIADALARRSADRISRTRYADAQADLDEAYALAEHGQNRPAMARILIQLTRLQIRSGNHPSAIQAAEAARRAYHALGDGRGAAEALNLLGAVHGQHGAPAQAVALLEEALNEVRGLPYALDLETRILNNLAIFVGTPQAAYDLFRRFGNIAAQTGSLVQQETAHQNLAELLCRFGAYDAAQPHLTRALELATLAQSDQDIGMLLMTRGQLQAALGAAGPARADLTEALRILEAAGARFMTMLALLTLGDYLLDQGSYAAGYDTLTRGYALWQALGAPDSAQYAALFAVHLARAHLGLRRTATARRAVAAALAALAPAPSADQSWTNPRVEVLAHCWAVLTALGQPAAAAAVLARGHARMEAVAADCGPELRTAYLEGVRECRLLRAAWSAQSADGSGTPPAAPAAAIGGKVATRRAELRVRYRDAAAHGVTLDEAALARSFGVSLRTLQRNLAALRQANPPACPGCSAKMSAVAADRPGFLRHSYDRPRL